MTVSETNIETMSQSDKFKQVACDLEYDEDEARWDDRLKKGPKRKPAPEKHQ
jgi:hypothetical protein